MVTRRLAVLGGLLGVSVAVLIAAEAGPLLDRLAKGLAKGREVSPEPDALPEPPARENVRPAADPWPVKEAVRITYDRKSHRFTLTNVSPHPVWFDGEPPQYPSLICQR